MNSEGIEMQGSRTALIKAAELQREKARQAKPEMMRRAERWAKKFGGSVVDNEHNVKSLKSIMEKIDRGEASHPKELGDVLRTTVVVEPDKFEEAVKYANAEAHRYSYGVGVIQGGKKYNGYTGFKSNFRARNGVKYEIQINTPKMIYAKEPFQSSYGILGKKKYLEIARQFRYTGGGQGHKYYEGLRNLDTKSRKFRRLDAKSNSYYRIFK